MTLLAPYALFGLGLLMVPILIHLLRPRKMRATPFSSLRWLRQTHQRLSRRIQWHQWLLFLLRAGVLTLLVLALARPLFSARDGGRPVDRFIIVDVGRSMAYRPADQPSSLEKAQKLTAKLLRDSRPGDRTALVLAGSRPKLISPLVADAEAFLPIMQAAHAAEADSHLDAALPLVRSLVRRDEGRDTELVFVTDNRASSWQQSGIHEFLRDLPQAPRVRIVDVGAGAARNGWISGAYLHPSDGDEGPTLRVEMGCVGDGPQERRVHLSGVPGLAEDSQPVTLRPGQAARVEFQLPPGLEREGRALEVRLEPGDALADDDRFFVNLDTTGSLRVLLVAPEAPSRDGTPVNLYLRSALESLTSVDRSSLEVANRTAASVSAGDVERAGLVILAGVPELSEGVVQGLTKRVRFGAGLIVFLGDNLKTFFYNQGLFQPLQPAEGLFPVPLKTGDESVVQPDPPAAMEGIRWAHPLLAPLYDPVFDDLPRMRAQRYAAFAGAVGANDNILARFGDGTPALIEHPLGAGRVLVFNTSADDSWSDLPRRKSYVPLVDRLISYLSAGGIRRQFTVGESITLPLTDHTADETVEIVTPTGSRQAPRLFTVGDQTFAHIDEVAEAGVYRVERSGGKGFTFVTNAGRRQSSLAPMESATLREWWAPATAEVITEDALAERRAGKSASWPLWPALILLAGLLLLVETIYVTVLCPRVNPTVVDPTVPRRGLLRPLTQDAPGESNTAEANRPPPP